MPQTKDRILTPEKRVGSFKEIYLGINRLTAIEDARIFLERERSLKGEGCVLKTDHLTILRLIAKKDFIGATKKLLEENPFAAFTGRLCPDPYPETQVFNKHGEKISLRSIERFLIEHVVVKTALNYQKQKKAVAIIGSGPSGLMTALVLAQKGYRVTVFEQETRLGGSLFFGWPEFLVPRKSIDQLILLCKAMGICFDMNKIFGCNMTYESLEALGFNAIVLATGAGVPKVLDIKNQEIPGVFHAQTLLHLWSKERLQKAPGEVFFPVGKNVLIVGGCIEGIHLARIIVRLKGNATILLQKDETDDLIDMMMLKQAKQEGVKIRTFIKAERIIKNENGFFHALVCDATYEKKDPQIFLKIKKMEESFILEADSLIVAQQTQANTLFYQTEKSLFLDEGRKGVFVTGAVADPSLDLLQTLVSGKKTAYDVDLYLKGDHEI